MKAKLSVLFCIGIAVTASLTFAEGENLNAPQIKTYRIERKITEESQGWIANDQGLCFLKSGYSNLQKSIHYSRIWA